MRLFTRQYTVPVIPIRASRLGTVKSERDAFR